jgi:hypothetical protein
MVRWEPLTVRHVQPAPGRAARTWGAWLEAALLVRTTVSAWEHADEGWLHWAVRLTADGAPAGDVVSFDPGRHASASGEPPSGERTHGPIVLDEGMARRWLAGTLAAWRPALHRHADLGLVSRLDEPGEEFRKRCLTPLRPLLQGRGKVSAEAAERLSRLARGIETIQLAPEHLDVRCARVAVVWYPCKAEPASAGGDPMVTGQARSLVEPRGGPTPRYRQALSGRR